MKKITLFMGLMFCLTFNTEAQITINADQIPVVGDSLFYQNAVDVDGFEIGSPGANQVWDYSTLAGGLETAEFYIDPTTVDSNNLFPNATIAITDQAGLSNQFAQVTANEVMALGLLSNDFLGFNVEIVLDPTQTLYKIPTNYEDSYTTDYGFSLGISEPQPGVDTARVLSISEESVEFDAFGTLRLPEGDFEVLRKKVETTTYLSVEAFVIFFWQPIIQDTTVTTAYDFYARESKRELARVRMDSLGNDIASISWQGVDALPAVAPVAAYTHAQSTVTTGQVDFTDESTNNPVEWLWDFGDGNTSTVQHPMHAYAVSGDYEVCLTASNSGGSDQICQMVMVDVTVIAPVAAFAYTADMSVIGRIDFEDLSTNSPTSWLWDFGDGESGTIQHPNHIYAAEGNYEVCLFATNDGGTSQSCQTIFVEVDFPIPAAAFQYVDTSSTPGLVHFEDLSSNLPTEWLWDFGDGNTSMEKDPQHTFADDNTYNVCLTVSNMFGSDQSCQMLFINVDNKNITWNPNWQIGPNPTQGNLFINIKEDFEPGLTVMLFTAQGQLLQTSALVNNQLIDVSNFSSGNYWLSIHRGKEILGTRKLQLIKQ